MNISLLCSSQLCGLVSYFDRNINILRITNGAICNRIFNPCPGIYVFKCISWKINSNILLWSSIKNESCMLAFLFSFIIKKRTYVSHNIFCLNVFFFFFLMNVSILALFPFYICLVYQFQIFSSSFQGLLCIFGFSAVSLWCV